MLILDGRALAARRLAVIAARAAAVRERSGRAPRLLIVAIAGERGHVPHVLGKLRACDAAGVAAVPLILAGVTTREAVRAVADAVDAERPDAVFVQVPLPRSVDTDAVLSAIPVWADVDIMTPARYDRYMSGADNMPPVTISAALLLLDEHEVDVRGRHGLVVAEASPFAMMFCEALRRAGARIRDPVHPRAPDLEQRLAEAELIVAAAGEPGLVKSSDLSAGTVAIDAGYFNEGGRGDIDTTHGIEHLRALMPVPGGIGPMTVSVLVERTVDFAEHMNRAAR